MRRKWRKLVRTLEAQGCAVTKAGSGHWRVRCPSGALVFVSDSPSDEKRAWLNVRADLRRAGVEV